MTGNVGAGGKVPAASDRRRGAYLRAGFDSRCRSIFEPARKHGPDARE